MKEEITYDDFAKLDMRIGTVLAAELVPNTDKLIKCTVDFGEFGKRTIVSGIAKWRTPENLLDKQFPYIVNLAPRTLRGVESQGMLMAPGTEDGLAALLNPDEPVENGVCIR